MGERLRKKAGILLVDDDEDLLYLMKTSLGADGYAVDISPNAEGIKEMIATKRPDIILLDIAMNGVDGGEVCRQLKEDPETRFIPIILLSGNHDIEKVRRECGADDYLRKPFNKDKAEEKFSRFLH